MSEKIFEINRIYVKDVSVETPNSPRVFTMDWAPEIDFQLGNATQVIDKETGIFEVALTLTVTAELEGKTAYVIEVEQAGIFTVQGFDEEEEGYVVGAMIPNMLFPYGREAVSSLSQKAGFPAMLLNPIDFNAVYQQHLQNQAEISETDEQPKETKH